MKFFITATLALTFLVGLLSCSRADVRDVFEKYWWQKRVVVIFSPDRNQDTLKDQIAILEGHKTGLDERDIVTWIVVDKDYVLVDGKTMPHLATPPIYKHFNLDRRDYTFMLLGKDGDPKLQTSEIVSAKDLFSLIDEMPMRKREERNR